jgi:hypothetical protein
MDGRIGIFVDGLEGYQGVAADQALRAARLEGLRAEVLVGGCWAINQSQNLLQFEVGSAGERVCALMVAENDTVHPGRLDDAPVYHAATRLLREGSGFIAVGSSWRGLVERLRAEFPGSPVGGVEIDHAACGRRQGRFLRTFLPGGGHVLHVRGNPLEREFRELSAGLEEELRGQDFVLEEIEAYWDEDLAERGVRQSIESAAHARLPVDAVLAQSDPLERAARRALSRSADHLGRPDLRMLPIVGAQDHSGRVAATQIARYWRTGTAIPATTSLPFPPLSAAMARIPESRRSTGVPGDRRHPLGPGRAAAARHRGLDGGI